MAAVEGSEGKPYFSDLERQFNAELLDCLSSTAESPETPDFRKTPGLWLLHTKDKGDDGYWSLNEEFGGPDGRRIFAAQLRADHPQVDPKELATRLDNLDPENENHVLKRVDIQKRPMYGWSGILRSMNIDPGEVEIGRAHV